jgi:hypothetical protein
MIEPGDTNSQYSPLALATGGSVAGIADTAAFSTIMNNIATNAGGASSQFILSGIPIAATISVTVHGTAVAKSAVNGWAYNAASNSVMFRGTALLSGGESVSVSYDYFTSTGTGSSGGTSGGNNNLLEGTWALPCENQDQVSVMYKQSFSASSSTYVINPAVL